MSGLKRKLEGEIEIRETAGDVYHEMNGTKPHHISNVVPHFVESCDLHEGEHGKPGTTLVWKYKIDGKPQTAKAVVEEIDEKKKLVKHKCIEGDILRDYKTMSCITQVIPKDTQSCIVKCTLEYEKLHSGVPEPAALLDHILAAAKDIDDHHHGIKK